MMKRSMQKSKMPPIKVKTNGGNGGYQNRTRAAINDEVSGLIKGVTATGKSALAYKKKYPGNRKK